MKNRIIKNLSVMLVVLLISCQVSGEPPIGSDIMTLTSNEIIFNCNL